MSIDPKYIAAGVLDEYFVDKTTGLPLAGGVINFYSDNNRSVPKHVYAISGTAPDYTFVDLGVSLTLSAVGTPVDESGNSIVIYYYPYDVDGNLDLYYVEVYSSTDVAQFTREAWPPNVAGSTDGSDIGAFNYIPNGQFLLHNDLFPNGEDEGTIVAAVTNVAPGGWFFLVPDATASVNNVSFPSFPEYVPEPSASPRFACRIVCSAADPSDDLKDLQIRFGDVNKFASNDQMYTFSLSALTYFSSNFTAKLFLVKNYGTGGSPAATEITQLTTFTITDTETVFDYAFAFGTNGGNELGTNGDDYVALQLSIPTAFATGCDVTNFALLAGDVVVAQYPQQTNRDTVSRTLADAIPNPDGSDLYLTPILTADGYIFDHSPIGKVYASVSGPVNNELNCDGGSHIAANYSSLKIPFSRLQEKLLATSGNGAQFPLFGTGAGFVDAYSDGATGSLIIATNAAGAQTATADVNTTFSFLTSHTGGSTYGFTSKVFGGNGNFITSNAPGGPIGTITSGTSLLTVSCSAALNNGSLYPVSINQRQRVLVAVGADPPASSYFTISNTATQYYVWFIKDGVGSDPAAGGTGIRVSYTSGMSFSALNFAISRTMNNAQVTEVVVKGGSAVVPNSYFTFFASNQKYAVWYSLNGAGTAPVVANAILIEVDYTTADTITVINAKTATAINKYSYAVPDLRGYVIKGSGSSTVDENYLYRYSDIPYLSGVGVGTYQYDMILGHVHTATSISTPTFTQYHDGASAGPVAESILTDFIEETGAFGVSTATSIAETGMQQNDVKNVNLNYVIKY